MLREFAPAKINLFLHVLGRRPDGYHALESLVTFADLGDHLRLEPGDGASLAVTGPQAGALSGEGDNLVLRAARAFAASTGARRAGRFTLEKHLPVASGIGGGSADAAAALRLLARLNGIAADDPRLMDAARLLGSDVPVCLDPASPRLMRGTGHELGPALVAKTCPAVLANPGRAVATAEVFRALNLAPGEAHRPVPSPGTRNDLEAPAVAIEPEIGALRAALAGEPGCTFARMSGSGATVFGLFERRQDAESAASRLAARWPGGWFAAGTMGLPAGFPAANAPG